MVMEDQVDMDMAVLTMKRDQLLPNIQVTMLLEVMVMEDQVDMVMAVPTMKRDQLLPKILVTMLLEVMVMAGPAGMAMEVRTMKRDPQQLSLVMATVTAMALPMFTSHKRTMDMAIQNLTAMATTSMVNVR